MLSTAAPLLGQTVPSGKPAVPGQVALSAALAQARSANQAMQLELAIESLRQQSVQPTVRLLWRRSQRELLTEQRAAALSDMNDAVDLQPDNAFLWRERAAVRAASGDLDGAMGDLGVALSRDATDVVSWQALADIEEGRSAWMEAYKAWQHVISIDPQIADGRKRLDRLRRRALGQPA